MKTKYVFLVLVLVGLNAFSQDRVGHVTLLKKNITAIRVTPGSDCPEGFKLKNGECVPITTAAKTEGIGHVTLLKKNITAIRVTTGTDCPDGFELKNGECVPITTIAPVAITEGGHVTLLKKNESGTPVTSKVKRTGHVTLLRFTQVYLGGGIFLPSTTTKNGGAVNGIDINLSLYQPIWVWGGKTENTGTSLGINVGGSYTVGNGDYTLDNRYTVYNLQGQSAPPTVVTNSNENTVNQGFKFEGGPQLNIHLGGITVSPIFNVGYLSMTQKSFAVAETLYLNTIEYPYDLLTQKETKTTGLAMIPKLRLTYNITPRIGIWAEGNYILGPQTEVESTRFVLDPTIPSDSYNLGHFQEGQYITTKSKVKYSGLGVNAGIVIGLGKGSEKPTTNKTVQSEMPIEEPKLPVAIQKLIDDQDKSPVKTFEYLKNKSNQKTSSLCNFNVEKVDIQCNGKDQQGKKKYKVTVTYKNLAASGVASLGHYSTTCSATPTNGSYLEVLPAGSATISNTLPATTVKTVIASGSTQSISFDFVPNSTFASLNIKGNLISSATNCGNCDDIISLNLPNCCDACELNPVTAINNSISVLDANAGTITMVNTVTSPNKIVRIQADLVAVKITPINNSCNKCNDIVKQQDNFVDNNKLLNDAGWANGGQSTPKPDYPTGASRSLSFNATDVVNGVNIAGGSLISHTIGVAPTSCCGDTVEIWIRYTLWDKDCKVCDKLVSATITRPAVCNTNGTGTGGTGTSSSSSHTGVNTNVKN